MNNTMLHEIPVDILINKGIGIYVPWTDNQATITELIGYLRTNILTNIIKIRKDLLPKIFDDTISKNELLKMHNSRIMYFIHNPIEIDPIRVLYQDNKLILSDGVHRVIAAKVLNYKKMLCYIDDEHLVNIIEFINNEN